MGFRSNLGLLTSSPSTPPPTIFPRCLLFPTPSSPTPPLLLSSQIASGFSRLLKNIDDLQLDLPGASDSLQRIICQASKDGWLPVSFKQSALPDLEAAEGAYSAEHSKVRRVLPPYL